MTSLAVLGLAATVAFTPPAQAQVSFLIAPTFATGERPLSLAVGDLDGDGDRDLVTANSFSNNNPTVSMLKNNGDGTFATPQNFTVADSPESVAVGDLDGDGDLDLATANYSDTVSVLKNDGNGIFAAPQNFAGGNDPRAITVGDLDGDGDLDLATVNRSSTVSVLKNNGNGTFAAVQSFVAGGYFPYSITVGDLDGDGDLDLVTVIGSNTNRRGAVSVLKNNGNGAFAAAQNFATGASPASVTVGDLDGDGDLDLATANARSSNSVSILANNGNGTFAAPQNFAVGDQPFTIVVGDLDGDGDLDLATANTAETVSVLKNKGNSTFAASRDFVVEGGPSSLTIGDLDGDGDLDLATANYFSGNVSELKNDGSGIFAASQTFATGASPTSVTVGDLDGDGDLDLATANYSDTVSVLKNNGDGTFAAPQSFTSGDYPRSITVGDLDGDSDLDLITTSRNYNTVSVLKNNGNGTFAAPQNFATGASPTSITVGDLDGDGDLDLATANTSGYPDFTGTVSVLKNSGNGTFAPAQDFAVLGSPESITIGDMDGDSDLDLATANRGSFPDYLDTVSVLKNNGDGTFAVPQNFANGDEPAYAITVGDLDRDGDLDLATVNRGSFPDYFDTASVLKNNGNGTFAVPQTFTVSSSSYSFPNSITIGDLDGDGDLDLTTANFGLTSSVSVLRNNGNATFAATQDFAIGGDPVSMTVGDLDMDGDLDLATANSSSGNVLVLQSTTPTLQLSTSPNRNNPTPLASQSVSGNVYIFASGKDTEFKRVQFYLDDPTRSSEPIHLESAAPFDFASGTVSTAYAFDTSTLTNGEHTITATFARTDGTYRTITSTFTVGN